MITRDELENVMGGVEMKREDWDQLVGECDENKDGKVSILFQIEYLTDTDFQRRVSEDDVPQLPG
jgi:hypothetical protein